MDLRYSPSTGMYYDAETTVFINCSMPDDAVPVGAVGDVPQPAELGTVVDMPAEVALAQDTGAVSPAQS
jgi:hypothetical protein